MKLFECIQNIPDPRKKRGIRHQLQPILKLVLLGFTCRLVAIEHIVAFFKPIWSQIKKPLGFQRFYPPNPTTIRRVLNGLKAEQLQEAFELWISEVIENKTFIASVDGKAMKNVKSDNGLALMLVNVFAQDIKLAIAEYPVKIKKGESTVLKQALSKLFNQYPGLKILVGDAAFSGRELNKAITKLGRDYITQIKENQPQIKKLLQDWFQNKIAKDVPDVVEIKKKV